LKTDLSGALSSPSWTHPLGTDDLGRDVLARVLHGGRLTLVVVAMTTVPAVVLAVCLGMIAGFYRTWPGSIVMRGVDVMMGFPGLLLAVLLVGVLGPSLPTLIVAMICYLVPRLLRLTHSLVLKASLADYVEAARATGCRDWRVMRRHILPNCSGPIVVQVTLDMGSVVLLASGLSFLGLGVARPAPEWGQMLSDGRALLKSAPLVPLAPAFALLVTIAGLNMIGEGLRAAGDPRDLSSAPSKSRTRGGRDRQNSVELPLPSALIDEEVQ
jgi:ABC-type dipeptide/oligopeptide/nickel transport system permease subunit